MPKSVAEGSIAAVLMLAIAAWEGCLLLRWKLGARRLGPLILEATWRRPWALVCGGIGFGIPCLTGSWRWLGCAMLVKPELRPQIDDLLRREVASRRGHTREELG